VLAIKKLIRHSEMKVAFRHVPRRLNKVSDAMCREALAAKADINYYSG
jgi:hypothetical protein